jgi:hypothetical protein
MARVVVAHADEPIGRRVVKALFHDPDVDVIFALGHGPPPRSFDRFLVGERSRVSYTRIDLAKHRPVNDLFHCERFRAAEINTVIYVPPHGVGACETTPLVGGISERTAESRLILQHCLEIPSIKNLIAISSAFVYRLPPGNANRLNERSELDLDPDVIPEIRSWIDCDMIFHGEVHNDRLRVVLLRVPTVVAEGGFVYMNPTLAGRPVIPVPGPLLDTLGTSGPHLRFGFTLDTSRAAAKLGFRARYRIGLSRAGDGSLRLETASR